MTGENEDKPVKVLTPKWMNPEMPLSSHWTCSSVGMGSLGLARTRGITAHFAKAYPQQTAGRSRTISCFVYWKPEGTESSGYVDLLFDEPVSFNVVMMQEFIRHGQKVSHYSISILEGEDWVEVAKGTTIGVKKMNVLEKPVSTKGVRLTIIDTWNDYVPEISRIGLFTSEYY